jgi:hypothetical protein
MTPAYASDKPMQMAEFNMVFTPQRSKHYANSALPKYQWGRKQYTCLVELWRRESNWNHLSRNKRSGAFGIAQFMPTTWGNYNSVKTTNAFRQIDLGLRYIKVRYTSPCSALSFHERNGWY